MEALIAEYFSRDLSDAEELRLEELGLKDAGVAEALAAEARRRYLSYGLPDPLRSPSRHGSWARTAAFLGCGLAAAAGLALVLVLPREAPRPSVAPPLAAAQIQWKASALVAGAQGLGFARSLSGQAVAVRLSLAQPELVVVTVVALDGRVLQILYAGPLPAGQKMLHWDRVDQDGRLILDDQWKVELSEGLPLGTGGRP